ncbi:calcium-dependent phosphotriesterase [Cenococcum geophilum 1.58]|uniref:calcium-dependent phosphotriesterase n=1 Tax=Cenococcum geophilum 1.58 TaxID=794803 RepID=UPI00358F77D6|nr:calcium-dependent phosphotriesterase [Cenococcum geophilum 1.58]
MNKYGSVLSEDYDRSTIPIVGFTDTYASTQVPSDPSFAYVSNASFLIYDAARAPSVLGPSPAVDFMFQIPLIGHEAPVYDPTTNRLFFSKLLGNETSQYTIDLSATPPTLSTFTSHPPTIVPAGGTFHAGLVYWLLHPQHHDPRHTPLLNNYFGLRFTTCDDLAVHPITSDVWFTDNYYAHNIPLLHRNNTPQLPPAVWRFRPSTGALQLVDDTLQQPNGIAFAADGRTAYVSDTSADTPLLLPAETVWTQTARRTVYAFDVDAGFGGVGRRRVLYRAQDRIPDGVKVARNGWVVAAAGHGVDVVDEGGTLVVRVDWEDLWLVGVGGVARVRWELPGREIV